MNTILNNYLDKDVSTVIIDFMGENQYQLNYKKCIEEYHNTYKSYWDDTLVIRGDDVYLACNYRRDFIYKDIFKLNKGLNQSKIAEIPKNYYL